MLKDIEKLTVLFQQLKSILEKENDSETLYIRNQLELGLHLIDEVLNSNNENKELEQLFSKLKEIYANINQPRVGLSDYFIWKDDYDERIEVNNDLDTIKESLTLIFQ
ncbi:hypothetical protein JOD29_002144 [Lysinibacillus composti]|uniref:Uncharacterized protein n=1 Tax=Lysinibacillus composti TaxID=720633 RepID=A0A3N9UDY9_9BACI|nr:hypothetical protein [Lysinibacillus composti]MBM7608878.1 hypothetical protein [Lysinibacillus composti]RQW74458.1 hypothetical protein EBB45_11250 [Lysinibacillus composti]